MDDFAKANEIRNLNDDESFAARAAWLYYIEEMTQSQIAKILGATRFKINRTLAEARASGLVQIHINSDQTQNFELAARLKNKFDLRDAIVVPTPKEQNRIHSSVGAGLGWYLSKALRDEENKVIGLGWGQTLRETIQFIKPKPRPDATIMTLLGALNRPNEANSFEIIYRFSGMISAERYYLTAPMYTSSEESRDILQEQDFFQSFRNEAMHADVACFAVGDVSSNSILVQEGLPREISPESIREAGAVGDLLGNFIDIHGNVVDHTINRQLVGLSLEELKQIKTVVMASGGDDKVAVITGALRTGVVDILVCDEKTANSVLNEA